MNSGDPDLCKITALLNTISFIKAKIQIVQLAAASDKVYQLLVHGRWFSPRILRLLPPLKLVAMIIIVEILLKVALTLQIKSNQIVNLKHCKRYFQFDNKRGDNSKVFCKTVLGGVTSFRKTSIQEILQYSVDI